MKFVIALLLIGSILSIRMKKAAVTSNDVVYTTTVKPATTVYSYDPYLDYYYIPRTYFTYYTYTLPSVYYSYYYPTYYLSCRKGEVKRQEDKVP